MEKFCQSCGMPLNNENILGSEKDHSKSTEYCSYCYVNGEFTNPEFTSAKEMQKFVYEKVREQGKWPLVAWFFTLMIPSLKRWKSK